jgi:hypothetical protein
VRTKGCSYSEWTSQTDSRRVFCPYPCAVDRIGICHSISLIYIAHAADKRIFSLAKTLKCHTMAEYLETSLFIRIYVTAIGIIIPVEMARVWFLTFNIRVGHGKTMTS